MTNDHTKWLNQAAKLAQKGAKHVSPNPMVGAILVKNNRKIGEGFHKRYGLPHAEIEAFKNAKKNGHDLKNSTLYVTLEPCCHHGKTPPCTEAIIKNGISRVIYSCLDPNPKINGKGIKELEKNLIKTDFITTDQTENLNAIYRTNCLKKRPFIHLKTACTIDGKITLEKGSSTLLTNHKSNKKTHALRAFYDAILVGVDTIIIDDPKLTVRLTHGASPLRIVLDSNLRTPKNAQILKNPLKTIIATAKPSSQKHTLTCKKNNQVQIDLNDLLKKLHKQGISSILVEGGEKISTSFLKANLVDRLTLIYTPLLSKNKNLPEFPLLTKNPIKKTAHFIEDNLWIDFTF